MVTASLKSGLFTGQEVNAEYYNDKDKKIGYLQKVIKLVEVMSGAPIDAKPQKIVAGLEPEVESESLRLLMTSCRSSILAQRAANHQSPM